MGFPEGYTPEPGKYTVKERDALFDRISAYPATSEGQDGQTLVVRNGAAAWEDPSGGGGSSGVTFSVELAVDGWESGAQTIQNAAFLASGYSYIFAPARESFAAYAEAQISADDITTDGSMTFYAFQTPSAALTVNILRLEAIENE